MEYGAQTEYGRLRKVLMHRPTEELGRITPDNRDAYLFRDVVYWREGIDVRGIPFACAGGVHHRLTVLIGLRS